MSKPEFSITDVEAVHQAFNEAIASAQSREGKMPSSAAAFRARAQNLLNLRNKLLELMPEIDRRNYPPYADEEFNRLFDEARKLAHMDPLSVIPGYPDTVAHHLTLLLARLEREATSAQWQKVLNAIEEGWPDGTK